MWKNEVPLRRKCDALENPGLGRKTAPCRPGGSVGTLLTAGPCSRRRPRGAVPPRGRTLNSRRRPPSITVTGSKTASRTEFCIETCGPSCTCCRLGTGQGVGVASCRPLELALTGPAHTMGSTCTTTNGSVLDPGTQSRGQLITNSRKFLTSDLGSRGKDRFGR